MGKNMEADAKEQENCQDANGSGRFGKDSEMPFQINELIKGFGSWKVAITVMFDPRMKRRYITVSDKDLMAVRELILAWNTYVSRTKESGGKNLHYWDFVRELQSLWIRDENEISFGEVLEADSKLGEFLCKLPRGFALRNL